jgi:hypothetical protein
MYDAFTAQREQGIPIVTSTAEEKD